MKEVCKQLVQLFMKAVMPLGPLPAELLWATIGAPSRDEQTSGYVHMLWIF